MTKNHSYNSISVIPRVVKSCKEDALTVAVALANFFEGSYRYQGYKQGHGRGLQEGL